MAEVTPIEAVPKDIDDTETAVLRNPTKQDFVHAFNRKEISIVAGGEKILPMPIAIHLAKHLAEKVIRKEHREMIFKIKDKERREVESRKAIPECQSRIFKYMRKIVVDVDGLGEDEKRPVKEFFGQEDAQYKITRSR